MNKIDNTETDSDPENRLTAVRGGRVGELGEKDKGVRQCKLMANTSATEMWIEARE